MNRFSDDIAIENLFQSITDKDPVRVLEIIENGADVLSTNRYGYTPLHHAAAMNSSAVVEAVLAAGGDVRAKDNLERTPLHATFLASNEDKSPGESEERLKIVESLMNAGAVVNAVDDQGLTPLYYAVNCGSEVSVVASLLARGADTTFRESGSNNSLLHISPRQELTKELIDHGADVNSRNNDGLTPLLYAVVYPRENTSAVVQELLGRGADPNVCDCSGRTSLGLAVMRGYGEIAGTLMKHGADVDVRYLLRIGFNNHRTKTSIKHVVKTLVLKKLFTDKEAIDEMRALFTNPELAEYLNQCCDEVSKMKDKRVSVRQSVYEISTSSEQFFRGSVCWLSEEEVEDMFPIYKDVILPGIRDMVERERFLRSLDERNRLCSGKDKEVVLFQDCLEIVVGYLPNKDLGCLKALLPTSSK